MPFRREPMRPTECDPIPIRPATAPRGRVLVLRKADRSGLSRSRQCAGMSEWPDSLAVALQLLDLPFGALAYELLELRRGVGILVEHRDRLLRVLQRLFLVARRKPGV